MAFIGYEVQYGGTRAGFWTAFQAFMEDIGWVIHDAISATVIVWKTNGESGNEPTGYIWVDAGTSTYIQFRALQWWNSTTHAGAMTATSAQDATVRLTSTYFVAGHYAYLAGDKDFVMVSARSARTSAETQQNGSSVVFGQVSNRYNKTLIKCQGTAGTAGTLTVATTAGLGKGSYWQICGSAGEGRDVIYITDIVDATTIKVTSLPRSYGTGAIMGQPASAFGITASNLSANFYLCSAQGAAGTTVTEYTAAISAASATGINIIDFFLKRYRANPVQMDNPLATIGSNTLGLLGNYVIHYNPVAAADFAVLNNDGSVSQTGTATSGSASTLVNSAAPWTTNSEAGRLCIISTGTGVAQVRRIVSNTTTTLTIADDWVTAPDSTSEYKIADRVWRSQGTYLLGAQAYGTEITHTQIP